MMTTMSKLEDDFETTLKLLNFPAWEREYRFAAMLCGGVGDGVRERLEVANLKDWRIDFAWPVTLIGVELEGGTWSNGGHVRGAGYADNCRKYNTAELNGWHILRFTSDMLRHGEHLAALDEIRGIVEKESG